MNTRKSIWLITLAALLCAQGSISAHDGGDSSKALKLIASVEQEVRAVKETQRKAVEKAKPAEKLSEVEEFFQRLGCTTCLKEMESTLPKLSDSTPKRAPAPTSTPVAEQLSPIQETKTAGLQAATGTDDFAQRLFEIASEPTQAQSVHRSTGQGIEVPVSVSTQNKHAQNWIEAVVVNGGEEEDLLADAPSVTTVKTITVEAKATETNTTPQETTETTPTTPTETSTEAPTTTKEEVVQADNGPSSLLKEEYKQYLDLQKDLSREVSKEKYRLQIGDSLIITIYGEDGTGRSVTVDPLGNISYILVGSVPAYGKTIEELRDELNDRVKKIFKHAIVTVTPAIFGGQFYTILGEVNVPGRQVLTGKMSVLSAIAQAGGLRGGTFRTQTIDLADLSHAFLARDGDYVPVDFKSLILDGDMTQDLPLHPGDYIYIPSTLYKEIYILGAVNSPSTIGYHNVVTLAEAICQARGVVEDRASSRAIIIRGSLVDPIRIEADLKRIFKGEEKDVVLQPGDIVFVPERRFNTAIDWVRLGIRAFVSAAASSAGSRTFINSHPHAGGGGNVVTPVTVVNP